MPDETPEPPSPEDLANLDAERQALGEKRKQAREEDDGAAKFWRAVFADPVGRREMWAILDNCHALETDRFATGPVGFPQDMASWHWAGQRDIGLRLWRSWLRLDPDGVLLMTREHDPAFKTAPERQRPRRVRAGITHNR